MSLVGVTRQELIDLLFSEPLDAEILRVIVNDPNLLANKQLGFVEDLVEPDGYDATAGYIRGATGVLHKVMFSEGRVIELIQNEGFFVELTPGNPSLGIYTPYPVDFPSIVEHLGRFLSQGRKEATSISEVKELVESSYHGVINVTNDFTVTSDTTITLLQKPGSSKTPVLELTGQKITITNGATLTINLNDVTDQKLVIRNDIDLNNGTLAIGTPTQNQTCFSSLGFCAMTGYVKNVANPATINFTPAGYAPCANIYMQNLDPNVTLSGGEVLGSGNVQPYDSGFATYGKIRTLHRVPALITHPQTPINTAVYDSKGYLYQGVSSQNTYAPAGYVVSNTVSHRVFNCYIDATGVAIGALAGINWNDLYTIGNTGNVYNRYGSGQNNGTLRTI